MNARASSDCARPLPPALRVPRALWVPRALRAAVGLCVCLLLGAGGALGQARYGDATIEQGTMTLVREGKKLPYGSQASPVTVLYNDLIIVHGKSRVIVKTVEGANLTMGANAAFEVKPFRQRSTLGSLRLLFGRVRTKISQLRSGEEFAIKTATATIGIKGTEFVTSVTAQGDTLVVVDETDHSVALTGLEGPGRELTPDVMAAVVNNQPVSSAALVTAEVRAALALEDLASPAAYRPEAKALRGEAVLVRAGIVSEKDLVESKRDRAGPQDAVPFDETAPRLQQRYELRPEDTRPYLEFNLFVRPGQ